MTSPDDQPLLRIERTGGVMRLTLNRPKLRNAFNAQLIEDLSAAIAEAGENDAVRCIVLAGAGKVFCAGADLGWMKSMIQADAEANTQGAYTLAGLFEAVDRCPKPTIARIQGAAVGGGVGLVACTDIPMATRETKFSFSEVRLGLAPAVISPFVVRKIGVGAARELFVTGSRFSAERAYELGLVNRVLDDEAALDEAVEKAVGAVLKGGPNAVRACKQLALTVTEMDALQARQETAAMIAALRRSPEGQEGMRAFLSRDQPAWTQQDPS